MTLSDKVCDTMTGYMIYSKDVKQFIKDIKKYECEGGIVCISLEGIDKLAGDKLI